MSATTPSRTQAERADQTRARILDAAVREFSENGLAGARTEQIAEAAGVNKALLYYYFEGKETLYAAALESVAAARTWPAAWRPMTGSATAGERLLRAALNHFDRIHYAAGVPEPDAAGDDAPAPGEENALTPLVERVFRPHDDATSSRCR